MSGAPVAAPEKVPLMVPTMPSPEALTPYLARMHAARHYSNFGPLVQELEATLAARFGLPADCVATVANATLGLELCLHAMGLPAGARVLLPTFTFVATATAVVRAGLVPVLSDVDAHSWLLTPELAREACARTRVDAVLPVCAFGMPHDMRSWQAFEQATGVPVLVDSAAGFGSQWLGDAEGTLVFSLHTTKSLPAGEGGLVVSTRPGLAARVRRSSNFGINLDPAAGLPVGALADVGTNAKMSEFHAAVGLASLQTWDAHASQRCALQARLMRGLDEAAGGQLSWQASGLGGPLAAPTSLCARLPDGQSRAALEAACARAQIGTRRWYQPLLHRMPALAGRCDRLDAPRAHALEDTLLGLPFFLGLDEEQIDRVMHTVGSVLAPRPSVAAALAAS